MKLGTVSPYRTYAVGMRFRARRDLTLIATILGSRSLYSVLKRMLHSSHRFYIEGDDMPSQEEYEDALRAVNPDYKKPGALTLQDIIAARNSLRDRGDLTEAVENE